MFSFISPLPKPMNSATNAHTMPSSDASPKRQSTPRRITTITIGAVTDATKSGN